jgi:glycosyltransferase involved in cell wall biosynthesis
LFKYTKRRRGSSIDRALLSDSAFFDAQWYERSYSDVSASGMDPLSHYLKHGGKEGRDPSPFFDAKAYLHARPDVAKSGMNPLVHFLKFGFSEISGDLERFGVLSQVPSAALPSLQDVADIEASPHFDRNWYRAENPEVGKLDISPALHYLLVGGLDGKSPGPFFRGVHTNTDSSGLDEHIAPLLRYIRYGGSQGDAIRDTTTQAVATRKAVFVVHDLNVGGAPILLANIARWFRDHTSYDVRIVAMTGGPLNALMQSIAPTYVIGTKRVAENAAAVVREKLRTFIGDEPAFTFLNSAASGGYCEVDPYLSPTLSYIHEAPKILEHFAYNLDLILKKSDHIICGGNTVYDHFRSRLNVSEERLSNQPAFIRPRVSSTPPSAEEKRALRVKIGIKPEPTLVVGCGVLHWRKQPDVFVRMAAELALKRGRNVRFLWVGDGEDMTAVRKMAKKLKVSSLIEFVGYQEDIYPFLEAADIFALTSSEDPFPLVCLEAGLMGAPSVVFREATGMTAVVEPEGEAAAGIAVTLGDENAFFSAVDQLIVDDDLRSLMGRVACQRVASRHVVEKSCPNILQTIRTIANLPPKVSIIVPNYNCGPYLKQRLDSIDSQTFCDVEILLLDDASSDGSEKILSDFAQHNTFAKLFLADENGGSVFKAWDRGIMLAKGDLIWIAEADDWCEPDFLKKAVSKFSQSGVRLVHGRSIPVKSDGSIAGDWNDLYLDHIALGRWRKSFTSPACKEVKLALGRANTIPNASAVVVLQASARRAISIAQNFKVAGDWAFYLAAAAGGQISYCHDAINYHRRHEKSVTAELEGNISYFQDLQNIAALVKAIYGPDGDRDQALAAHIGKEAERFGWKQPLPQSQLPCGPQQHRAPGVLYGVGDLSGGGAQMFATRFVNRWVEYSAPAVLFTAEHEPDNPATVRSLSPEVAVVTRKDIEAANGLGNFMRDWGLNVAISGHWWADVSIGEMISDLDSPPPWVIVMHGCYENVLANPKAFGMFEDHIRRVNEHCSHWIWTADKNRRIFEEGYVTPRGNSHITNGFTPTFSSRLNRSDLGIGKDALVFALASRAIESKGWGVAVEAFEILRRSTIEDIHLLLIGEGPARQAIRGELPAGLHLISHTSRLADYIKISDVCLLPSWFEGESLPLVVIEFLAQSKPAIVSDIGMCRWAITDSIDGSTAGFIVPRDGRTGRVLPSMLADAMRHFVTDPQLKLSLSGTAAKAFEKFDMETMIGSYREIFDTLLENHGKDNSAIGSHFDSPGNSQATA